MLNKIKRILFWKKVILFLLFFSSFSFAQIKDPDKILEKIVGNFETIHDYQVNVKIKVDVEFIKAPVTDARIYYKHPDKIHIESETFAMLPKEGLNSSPLSLLKENYTAIYSREDTINGFQTAVVKVIPAENKDIILTTLWIDEKNELIRRIESTTKLNGTFTIDFNYDENMEYPLPSKMIFTFDVDKINFPRGFNGDFSTKKDTLENKKRTTGKVYLDYSNYEINAGISDKIFEEGNK